MTPISRGLSWIFLWITTITCYGQMKKHTTEKAFGNPVIYIEIPAEVESRDYVIFLHGAGEIGPLDASKLDLVLKHGWPKEAKNGKKFTFNLIIPQSQSVAAGHRNLVKYFPAYIKMKYNARSIFVTGLSMGGYGAYDAILTDNLGIIDGIASVCGAGRSTMMNDYREMTAWHFHGDKDSTVSYRTAKAFVDSYNTSHTSKIKWTLYPGVGHNSWDKAYSIVPGEDELLQWVIQIFKEKAANDNNHSAELEEIKRRIQILLQLWEKSKNDFDQVIHHIGETITPPTE